MATTSSAAAPLSDRDLVVTRIFDAPRRLVFEAWIDAQHAAHWWGPQGFVPVSCEMDVRPGGAWRRAMRSPDGRLHVGRGIYREIVVPERLVFTYAWVDADGRPGHETLVSVIFAERAGKTELTLRQSGFATATARDAHREGWTSCLERFAEYLASL
jgi:uncharacterized protein YndB with AHSA1/START domain